MPYPAKKILADELPVLDRLRLVSAAEAGRLRGVSPDTIERMAKRGEIPSFRVSPRRIAFRLCDVLSLAPSK